MLLRNHQIGKTLANACRNTLISGPLLSVWKSADSKDSDVIKEALRQRHINTLKSTHFCPRRSYNSAEQHVNNFSVSCHEPGKKTLGSVGRLILKLSRSIPAVFSQQPCEREERQHYFSSSSTLFHYISFT